MFVGVGDRLVYTWFVVGVGDNMVCNSVIGCNLKLMNVYKILHTWFVASL